jgi:hypothetical protein
MPHLSYKRAIIYTSAILCIIVCIADLVLIYILGNQIPGYNQLTSSISALSVSSSPVSESASLWSVLLGVVFVVFGFGFRAVFREYGRNVQKAYWLILIYGLGEGVASGAFRADEINGVLTRLALVHDLLGGIGVTALLLLPLVLRKIFTSESFPHFFRFSGIVGLIGLGSIILFSFRINYFENTFLYTYSGIWQRIFLINYYVYFTVIAIMMIQKVNRLRQIRNKSI